MAGIPNEALRKMLDDWVPPEWTGFISDPVSKWRAVFEETAVVQFNHRTDAKSMVKFSVGEADGATITAQDAGILLRCGICGSLGFLAFEEKRQPAQNREAHPAVQINIHPASYHAGVLLDLRAQAVEFGLFLAAGVTVSLCLSRQARVFKLEQRYAGLQSIMWFWT